MDFIYDLNLVDVGGGVSNVPFLTDVPDLPALVWMFSFLPSKMVESQKKIDLNLKAKQEFIFVSCINS